MQQQRLFDCGAPPRPKYFCDEVTLATVEDLMPKIIKWMRIQISESFLEEIKEDLIQAIDFEDDGFEIVSALKERQWNCDSELVDILDDVGYIRYDIYKNVVAQWVSNHGVAPSFSVGHRVAYRRSGDLKQHVGEITKVDEKHGQYVIFSEQLGHVREGSGVSGTTGTYVDYENVLGFEENHAIT